MKKIHFITVLLCFCPAISCYSQYHQLLHKTYAQRVKPLLSFYEEGLAHMDSVNIFKRIDSIKKLAVDYKDEDLLLETELLRAHYFYYRRKFPIPMVLSILDSLKLKGVKGNKLWLVARAENLMALYDFSDIQQYELAFEHFQKMYNILINFTSAEFPLKQTCLYQMADSYYYFSDFKKAIFYMQESLSQTSTIPEWHYLSISSLNTIGLCYKELKLLDSSDHYFNRAYQKSVAENNRAWIGISSGGLGYNCFLREQYDKAIPLLQRDVDIAVEYKDWGLASGSLMPLAAINLRRNNIAKASEQLQQARQYAYRSGQYKRLETLYPLLSKLYAAKGNAVLSAMYLDSFIYVKDSVARKVNALQILRAQQKVELEEQKARIDNIINHKKIQALERDILIVAVVLLMSLSVYVYRQQEIKQRLNKKKLQKSEEELALATKELDNFTKYISEKNNFIETLQLQLDEGEKDTLQKLQESTILTDDEWGYFCQLFEKVHIGYLQRLKEKLPGLTPAEIRFMTLSKLKRSNKEMAGTLGIGTDAIRKYRSRLRKKLNLAEEDGLEKLVETI